MKAKEAAQKETVDVNINLSKAEVKLLCGRETFLNGNSSGSFIYFRKTPELLVFMSGT